MKKQSLKGALAAILGTAAALSAVPAAAYQAGDMILRAGPAGVFPTGESEGIGGLPVGAKVEADDGYSLGINFTYMATSNIGVEVLGAWPFEHDIEGEGSISALDTVAKIKHLPPTVTLQYHFDTGSKFHPYIGAGINYTYFFDEDTKGALSGADLDLDDSWGLAGEIGVDYELQNDWMVSGQVWYIDIETTADVTGLPNFDVQIDPWVVMFSVGKKF
ncbi:MAG: OmpW family outer membrane protein [Gammaproteobacteria bacterium]